MNITTYPSSLEGLGRLCRILGQPVRIQILLVIGLGEACVCHLEAYLGIRQAAISQHLMMLRDAGLVTTNRNGRNIYYRLTKPELLGVVWQMALLIGLSAAELNQTVMEPVTPCPCPYCNPGQDDNTGCSGLRGRLKIG
jgi:DNA-binding transcriptional ArsR family regulator